MSICNVTSAYIVSYLCESALVNISLYVVIEEMSLLCFQVFDKIKDAIMQSDTGIKDRCVYYSL